MVYVVALGRELPTSPSFTLCQNCLDTDPPTVWANKLVHSFLSAQSTKPRLMK